MRRAAHVDGNHHAVVAELRRNGIAVLSLAAVGKGCPDLLCAFRDVTVLLEVKNPDSDRGTPSKVSQVTVDFIASWPGKAYVVWSPEEAVRVVIEAARPADAAPLDLGLCKYCGRPERDHPVRSGCVRCEMFHPRAEKA